MKVAVFLTWDYSLKTWNKSGTINRELTFFRKIEEDRDVLFSFFSYGKNSDIELANRHGLHEVNPIYSSTKYYKNKLLRLLSSFVLCFKFRNKFDSVDLLFQNQLLGCWVPILVKKIYKKPLIIRTGYDMLDFAKQDRKPFYIIYLYKILTKFAIKNCDYFTVTSKTDLEKFMINYPKYEHKFLLRQNWVKVNEFKELNNRYNNKILAVGRLVMQKNFSYLISEFKNSKNNLEIDIVGCGPDKDALSAQAKNQNVKVNLLGNFENDELLKLYQKYKFFISTSLFEGNPKSLLEAMGSGCVVIGSNIDNHNEIISDGKNGYLFEIKNSQLLNKFDLVSQNDEVLSQVSKEAHLFIKDKFSLNKSAESFYKDFEKVLSK